MIGKVKGVYFVTCDICGERVEDVCPECQEARNGG